MSLSSFPGLFTLKLALARVGPKGRKSLQGDVQNYCSSLVLQQVLRFREASTVLLSHQQPVFSQPYCCCGIDFIVSFSALPQAELSPPTSLFLNRPLHAVGECLTFWKHFHWFSPSLQQNTISLVMWSASLSVCSGIRLSIFCCSTHHRCIHFLFFTTTISFLSWGLSLFRSSSLLLNTPYFFVQQTLIKFSASLMYSAVYPDCSV